MTTTDTDALTERIARALYVEACEEEDGALTWETEESVAEEIEGWERFAAAVLPIVAAEVRKAQADAWDRAVQSLSYSDGSPVEVLSNPNPYRETGDSDEHR